MHIPTRLWQQQVYMQSQQIVDQSGGEGETKAGLLHATI